jgi:pimeloyl-ACP methyl ester carboxylesterase
VNGLFLQGSYSLPDLSASNIKVLVMMGAQDGLIPPEEVRSHDENLPADAQFLTIEGGNHAQFGWYGEQSGDNPATISHEEQQQQVSIALLSWLETMP